MEKWQPPRFGPKQEDEVTCYAFAGAVDFDLNGSGVATATITGSLF